MFTILTITTLIDNVGSEHLGLCAEHGLSFLIENDAMKFLFDFGAGETTVCNAKKMNIDISKIDIAVCSHSHYDHGGGFASLIEEMELKKLITGKGFFEPKYVFDGIKYTYLGAGFDEELLKKKGVTHQICKDTIKIDKSCYVVGNFQRTHSFEIIPQRFVKKTDNGFVKDGFEDEVCLVLLTEKGLVVIVGCSHPGIINMLETISKRFNQPVYAVLGGTHLVEADEERIKLSICKMKKMGLKLIGLSHCSGDMAQSMIRQDKDVKSCHLAVGDSIIF